MPESRIREVREKGANPRTLDWPAPATGDRDREEDHQRPARAGRARSSIASPITPTSGSSPTSRKPISPAIKIGTRATRDVPRLSRHEPIEGEVTFIYPELRTETRTARVRIEIANPDGRLKADMYADVVFQAGAGERPGHRRAG